MERRIITILDGFTADLSERETKKTGDWGDRGDKKRGNKLKGSTHRALP
jgi:hypothetical protein